MNPNTLRSQVLRLRVFRFLKEHMEKCHECPSAELVAKEMGVTGQTIYTHFRALRNATGLLMAIPIGRRPHFTEAGAILRAENRGRSGNTIEVPAVDSYMKLGRWKS